MRRSLVVIELLAVLVVALPTLGARCSLPVDTRTEPVGVREASPDIVLRDQDNALWSLAEKLAEGPVVVVFYRGHW